MLPLRLVLDTNVVISGALKPQGLERATLTFALTPPARLYVSRAILAEYREVLARPELRIATAERKELLGLIGGRARLIHPTTTLTACTDPDGNIFLECADAARADYLLTGNQRHFPPYWKSTKIVNARELVAIVAPIWGRESARMVKWSTPASRSAQKRAGPSWPPPSPGSSLGRPAGFVSL